MRLWHMDNNCCIHIIRRVCCQQLNLNTNSTAAVVPKIFCRSRNNNGYSVNSRRSRSLSSQSSPLPPPPSSRSVVDVYQAARLKALDGALPGDILEHAVFSNNETALANAEVYGFDYDYTLANYSDSLQCKIFEMGLESLISTKKYPAALSSLKFNKDFAIRGLHFDPKNGFLLKLDAFHHIQKDTVYRGLARVPWSDVIAQYSGFHVPVSKMNQFHGSGSEMHQFVDMFAQPEVSLIAQVTDYFLSNQIDYDPEYVFWDVKNSVQSIHSSGELHQTITENLSEYLTGGHRINQLLERLREHGKRLFLISNSGFPFINKGMTHMIGQSWRELFDVVIIDARKPDFFSSQKRPFRVYNTENGTNMWHRVLELKEGQVYAEGNLFDLRRFTGWSGSGVLYFGDHVYTDLADATLHHGWRTGAIIPELQQEIRTLNQPEFKRTVLWMVALQELIEDQQGKVSDEVMESWQDELHSLRIWSKEMFNKQFGSLFRTHHNPTYFSRRLHRFADLYTADLTNLLHYSVNHTFYPRRGALAHEMLYNIVS